MNRSTLERLAPLTGIGFVILIILAAIIGGETPDTDDSTASVVQFWQDNDSSQIWACAIGGWATVLFVWFAASLRSVLRRAEGDAGRLSSISFGGALLLAAGLVSLLGFAFAAADTVDDVPAEVTQTLSVLNSDFFFLLAVGNGLFLLGAALCVLRYAALPRWLGYVALVLGIAAVTPIGFFAFLAMGIWVIVVSILLYQRGGPATPAPTPGAAA
jgi:hypothetical protein